MANRSCFVEEKRVVDCRQTLALLRELIESGDALGGTPGREVQCCAEGATPAEKRCLVSGGRREREVVRDPVERRDHRVRECDAFT